MLRVDVEGRVENTHVVHRRGDPGFESAALNVFRTMRFTPATYRGCRIPFIIRVPVSFSPG